MEGLAQRLHELWDVLGQTNQQMMSYLLHREQAAPPAAPPLVAVPPLAAAAPLAAAVSVGDGPPPVERIEALERAIQRKLDELAEANRAGFRELAGRLSALSPPPGPPAPCPPAAAAAPAGTALPVAEVPARPAAPSSSAGGAGIWPRALLGAELAAAPQLGFQRQRLLDGVLEGDAAARWFVGLLLVFQAAPPEKMPPLLKDLGEALYRWQPKTSAGANPFETALVRALLERCQAAGINNTIELVNPGERFDAARHNATTRGVEISEVHGWVVLRDNGKVYTKANVAVK